MMLRLKSINFYYNNDHNDKPDLLLSNFNLKILDREFLSLVGPSGCGKTTLVNIIAGYLKPSSGQVVVGGKSVAAPSKDRIVINQENDLFDWMTVYENMKLVTKKDVLIKKYLKITKLDKFKNYYPRELSGGMKKRLSLARALAVDSKFIIMDEPFGSLDTQIKEKLYEEVLEIIKKSSKTVLLVTHDIEEAIFLSDRILLLSGKPISVKKEVRVPFKYPRTMLIKNSSKFRRCLSSIKQAVSQC